METLKCSSCGAVLNVDSDEKYIICEYCNSTNVNPHAAPKNHVEELIQNIINKAEAYIKFGNYDEALSIYKQLANDYPNDYRGHWGKVFSTTKNFTYLDISDSALNDAEFDCENALTTAPKNKKFDLANTWNSYTQKVQAYRVEDSIRKKEIEHQAMEELASIQKIEIRNKNIRIVARIGFLLLFLVYNFFYFRYVITNSISYEILNSSGSVLSFYLLLFLDVTLSTIGALVFKSKIYAYLPPIASILANIIFVFFSTKGLCEFGSAVGDDCSAGVAFVIFFAIGYFISWVCTQITSKLVIYINGRPY